MAACFFVCHSVRGQTAGTLDPSFNESGWAVNTFSSLDALYGMAVQPDGKIVAVGQAERPNATHNLGIARFNADGALDASLVIMGG